MKRGGGDGGGGEDAHPVSAAWDALDAWLQKERPLILGSLCAGSSVSALEAVEAELALAFPKDLRQLLLRHDGQDLDKLAPDLEAEHMFCSSDGAPLLLLGAEGVSTHKNADNWERVCLSLHGAKKPAARGRGGRGTGGLGLAEATNSERWNEFFLFASSEPLGAEESSVGVALLTNESGKSAVVEVSLQHSTIDEAEVVAEDVAQWLGNQLQRMQKL